jgi:hypothetical protein
MDESKEYWKWDGGLESIVEIVADHLEGSDADE